MSVFWSITFKTTAPQNVTDNTEGISQFQLHPALPLPADPRALAFFFFALDGKFPGVGNLELSNPPGWGRKKRANAPSTVNTATFFTDRTVEECCTVPQMIPNRE